MSCKSPGNLIFGSPELVQGGSTTVEAYLGDIEGLVPDHNKANITIKQVTRIFSFPSTSYVYTIL